MHSIGQTVIKRIIWQKFLNRIGPITKLLETCKFSAAQTNTLPQVTTTWQAGWQQRSKHYNVSLFVIFQMKILIVSHSHLNDCADFCVVTENDDILLTITVTLQTLGLCNSRLKSSSRALVFACCFTAGSVRGTGRRHRTRQQHGTIRDQTGTEELPGRAWESNNRWRHCAAGKHWWVSWSSPWSGRRSKHYQERSSCTAWRSRGRIQSKVPADFAHQTCQSSLQGAVAISAVLCCLYFVIIATNNYSDCN